MKVIGIDPGIAITGCCIISEARGVQTLLHSEAILTDLKLTTAKRLEKIYLSLQNIVKSYRPDVAALESLFFNTNAKTALIVGQARGVVQLVLTQNDIPIVEYTPPQVKMSITGFGHADKKQVQMMVKQILKLKAVLTPDDVADAAAIALTHCFSYKLRAQLSK